MYPSTAGGKDPDRLEEEGHVFLTFMAQHNPGFPNDGIRYMDQEIRYEVPAGPRVSDFFY